MIACPDSVACARACLFGDESQQRIVPQLMHRRRCSQRSPVFRHSSQPAMAGGSSVIAI
jgi:hypothetical protein